MPINLQQNSDGSFDLDGQDHNSGGFVFVTIPYTASSVDAAAFVASRAYIVKSVIGRPTVAGTDAGAVTASVKVAPSGTATASGTAVHSGTYNLKGTIHTNQTLTLSTTATDLQVPAGSAIGVDFTGTLTAAVGSITIALAPA